MEQEVTGKKGDQKGFRGEKSTSRFKGRRSYKWLTLKIMSLKILYVTWGRGGGLFFDPPSYVASGSNRELQLCTNL